MVLFTVLAATKITATPLVGPIVNPANGHSYYLLDNSNWTDAQSQALTLGGNLVTINDAAEGTWVTQQFADYNGVQRNLWIGLNAISLNGSVAANYSWVNGESSSYRNWAGGEPNMPTTDDYVQIIGIAANPSFGLWNNTSNDAVSGYGSNSPIPNFGVVEVVPEPATWLLVSLGGLLLCRFGSRRPAA